MSENVCPNVSLARNQRMWVVKESVDKTLEFPAATDIINVTGDVICSQEIPFSDSKEKDNTLNKRNVFAGSASAASMNIAMYLRPNSLNTPMQGDALIEALQGKKASPFTGTLAEALTVKAAQVVVTVASGHVPQRGVIEITGAAAAKELIHYRKAVLASGKWTFSMLTRGYMGSAPATATSGNAVTLKSRVFVQDMCRGNVSAWVQVDSLLQAVQGCHVTEGSISIAKEDAVELTGTLTGRRLFLAGPSSLTSNADVSATSLVVESAKLFFVGQKLQNTTKKDDNSGAGYAVTSVDESTNTITVAPGVSSAWAADDVVTWWMPYGPAIGTELEGADSVIRLDNVTGLLRSCSVKFSTPTEFADELGERFPGQAIDTLRDSSVEFQYYARKDAAEKMRSAQEGEEMRLDVEIGNTPGQRVAIVCPRIKTKSPAMNFESATVAITQTAAILGVDGEDAVEIILE